jgi:Raf kinase inhibitor-like YbhB/YbcL family protein
MKLTSPAFKHQELMPSVYSCDGKSISPPLDWDNLPDGVKSLALIMDDPDSSSYYVHWVIFNIPPSSSSLEENITKEAIRPIGSRQGVNGSGRIGYTGPCPPNGTHRYFFKLYALDVLLDLDAGITKEDLVAAMQGHILEQTQLIGLYKRSR